MRDVFKRIRAFEYIGIRGEVSEFRRSQYKSFFRLKDARGMIECSAPLYKADKFAAVSQGTEIVAYGTVRVNERYSRYELDVDRIELFGIGALYQQYEALKERFRKEGLFVAQRKRRIPRFAAHVALISAAGKGAEDFQTVMRERAAHVRVTFIETRVQGVGAEAEVATAFDRAVAVKPDIIVLARGGGSYEDLFTFNQEAVVRAIVRAAVPVITGIGHTGDHHLADDVADLACETPSNAAQFLANAWQQGGARLERLRAQLDREMRDIAARALQRAEYVDDALQRAWERSMGLRTNALRALERALDGASPGARLRTGRERLSHLESAFAAWHGRAGVAWRQQLERRIARLDPLGARFATAAEHALSLREARLTALDPQAPLQRGYAIVTSGGRVVDDVTAIAPGDTIVARVANGTLDARVERITHDD